MHTRSGFSSLIGSFAPDVKRSDDILDRAWRVKRRRVPVQGIIENADDRRSAEQIAGPDIY